MVRQRSPAASTRREIPSCENANPQVNRQERARHGKGPSDQAGKHPV